MGLMQFLYENSLHRDIVLHSGIVHSSQLHLTSIFMLAFSIQWEKLRWGQYREMPHFQKSCIPASTFRESSTLEVTTVRWFAGRESRTDAELSGIASIPTKKPV